VKIMQNLYNDHVLYHEYFNTHDILMSIYQPLPGQQHVKVGSHVDHVSN